MPPIDSVLLKDRVLCLIMFLPADLTGPQRWICVCPYLWPKRLPFFRVPVEICSGPEEGRREMLPFFFFFCDLLYQNKSQINIPRGGGKERPQELVRQGWDLRLAALSPQPYLAWYPRKLGYQCFRHPPCHLQAWILLVRSWPLVSPQGSLRICPLSLHCSAPSLGPSIFVPGFADGPFCFLLRTSFPSVAPVPTSQLLLPQSRLPCIVS